MKATWTDEVRGYYMDKYPTDELGQCIKEGVTFENVFVSLQVFEALASVMGCRYEPIYDKWMEGGLRRLERERKPQSASYMDESLS